MGALKDVAIGVAVSAALIIVVLLALSAVAATLVLWRHGSARWRDRHDRCEQPGDDGQV